MIQTPTSAPPDTRNQRVPCRCSCRCGGNRHTSAGYCWPCVQGLHHECSASCRSYPAMSISPGVRLPEIAARRACNGGRP